MYYCAQQPAGMSAKQNVPCRMGLRMVKQVATILGRMNDNFLRLGEKEADVLTDTDEATLASNGYITCARPLPHT